MSTQPEGSPRSLPDRPNLRHLKDQAKALLKAGAARSVADAQFQIARLYGFASWPRLKTHVESLGEVGELKQAIDRNNLPTIRRLMTRNPGLHGAAMGYGGNGPLTWVAECRVPWEPPSEARLSIAQWMIDNGSDVHQGGDGPLMRAALVDHRIPMMELLVAHGADVNAAWAGRFPIIFAPCETLAPASLAWLLAHGADPNCADPERGINGTALDQVIATYSRSTRLTACINTLLAAGGTTRHSVSAALDILRGHTGQLAERLSEEPTLVHQRFPSLDFGATGMRRLTLAGGTLLHVAAEYGSVDAVTLLLERGADVNAAALLASTNPGGQTPIFHAVTQFGDWGLPVARLLVQRGADLSLRVTLPGHYERLDEAVECTPLGYALCFPGGEATSKTVRFLRECGAPE